MRGLGWDDATIAERYSGEVGEEWKERLSTKVDGREYVPGERRRSTVTSSTGSPAPANAAVRGAPRSGSGSGGAGDGSRTASPAPAGAGGGGGKVKVDDKYFARLGVDNASRPDSLPPSQGGKYGGFGNTPMPQKNENQALPGFDDLQKDPVAALTRGFGWFTTTVGKTAKTVNDDFIQPTAKQASLVSLPVVLDSVPFFFGPAFFRLAPSLRGLH